MQLNASHILDIQHDTAIPWWYLVPIYVIFLGGMLVLYPSVSPLILVGGILVLLLTFFYPTIILIAFVFLGVTKPWMDENIGFFQTFDYTFFLAILVVFSLIIRLIKYHNPHLPNFHRFLWPLILLSIMLFIGLIYTPSPDYGSVKAARFLLFNIPLFVATILFIQRWMDLYRIFWIIILFSMVFAFIMIYEGVMNYFTGDFLGYVLRMTVLGANPISTGRVLSFGLLILFVLAYYEKRVSLRYLLFSLSGFLFVCLLMTNTRGPIVSTVAAIFVFLVLFSGINFKQFIIISSGLIIFFVTVVMILPDFLTSRIIMYFSQDVGQQTMMVDRIDTVASRTDMWKMAITGSFDSFKQFLIGRGTGGFASLYPFFDFRWYPHNIFFEIMFEIGIIGLLLFVIHISKITNVSKTLINKTEKTDRHHTVIVVIVLAISAFIGTLISGDLADNRTLWFFFGMIIALHRLLHAENSKKN